MGRRIKVWQIFVLLLLPFLSLAQEASIKKDTKTEREKIQEYKQGFIANKIYLEETQKKDFWKIYKKYEEEKEALQSKFREVRQETYTLTATDEEIEEGLNQLFVIRQKQLDLEKAYKDKFLKVLTIRQLAVFYQAEREFKKLLMEKLRQD